MKKPTIPFSPHEHTDFEFPAVLESSRVLLFAVLLFLVVPLVVLAWRARPTWRKRYT